MAKKQPRPRGEEAEGEREERAKKPIIRENTAGCHPQNSRERERRLDGAIRRLYHSFPSWRLLRGETASSFRGFMTNLFDDRGTIYVQWSH